MPGSLLRSEKHIPLSSERQGNLVAFDTKEDLIRAFSSKVQPFSSGSSIFRSYAERISIFSG